MNAVKPTWLLDQVTVAAGSYRRGSRRVAVSQNSECRERPKLTVFNGRIGLTIAKSKRRRSCSLRET